MDNNLREALQQIVNLSEDDKIRLDFDSMKGLAPEITKIVESGNIAVAILSIFATSVAADGKLTGEEYSLVHAFLKLFKIEMDDEKMVARALLPPEIMIGSHLKYEMMQYEIDQ